MAPSEITALTCLTCDSLWGTRWREVQVRTSVTTNLITMMALSIVFSSWWLHRASQHWSIHTPSRWKKKKKIKVPMYLPWPELTQALKCMSVQWWRVQLWWDNSFKEMISFWLLWLKLLVGSGMRWHLSVCLFVRRSNSEISRWIIYRIQTVMTHTQKKKIAGAEKWWGGEVWFPSAELFGRCHGIWRFEACLFCLGTLPFVRPDCGWI